MQMLRKNIIQIKNKSGFTLVEVMMTVFLFSIIFGACAMILLAGTDTFDTGTVQIQLQQNLRKAMDWLKEDLRQSGVSQITNVPADGTWYSTITFKRASGVSGGSITWEANTIQYVLQGSPATQLRRIQNAQNKVIALNILSFLVRRQASTPNIVEVKLQAQKVSVKKHILTDILNFSVQLRN